MPRTAEYFCHSLFPCLIVRLSFFLSLRVCLLFFLSLKVCLSFFLSLRVKVCVSFFLCLSGVRVFLFLSLSQGQSVFVPFFLFLRSMCVSLSFSHSESVTLHVCLSFFFSVCAPGGKGVARTAQTCRGWRTRTPCSPAARCLLRFPDSLPSFSRLLLPQCRSEFPSQSRIRSSHPTHTTHMPAALGPIHPLKNCHDNPVSGHQNFVGGESVGKPEPIFREPQRFRATKTGRSDEPSVGKLRAHVEMMGRVRASRGLWPEDAFLNHGVANTPNPQPSTLNPTP